MCVCCLANSRVAAAGFLLASPKTETTSYNALREPMAACKAAMSARISSENPKHSRSTNAVAAHSPRKSPPSFQSFSSKKCCGATCFAAKEFGQRCHVAA